MATYYCPDGFQTHPLISSRCVVKCPEDKGYDLRLNANQPRCTYYNDPKVFVDLKSAIALQVTPNSTTPPTLESLKTGNWFQRYLYSLFDGAKTDFDAKFAVADAKIDKDRKIRDAFKALQDAENARAESPQAYQDARIRYYTLLKGETWVEEEKQRIANSEAMPFLKKISDTYLDMNQRMGQQRKTIEIVDSVKDKLGSLKDEYQYSVDTFSKQIGELRNQIQLERAKKQKDNTNLWGWLDTLLNVLVIVVLIIAAFTIGKRVLAKPITPNPYS